MSLLLCAATGRELAGLAPHFTPPGFPAGAGRGEAVDRWPEMTLWPLRLKHGQGLCCITGVGPVNAALALGLAFAGAAAAGAPVTGVCVAGVAGAFDLREFPLLSLCLVREEIWPEYGLHDGQSVTAEAFGFPLWQPGHGEAVRNRLSLPDAAALAHCGARCADTDFPPARSLTVAGVSASFARAADMRSRYRADLENMEGFAVAYACARQGVPCVEARCISNKVGPRAREERDFPGALRALPRILPALNLM
ncbi:futalosine hydrolase [uncultured Desulfovibrio sp.]|uniref:futalosine hydrolase n=1 Tax=uncultured Desulfovibrio sp. TaxID=167968 RepID=UPI0026258C0B|nr:futalosine hydrolase [uncultured Desulfovibrio sp.]